MIQALLDIQDEAFVLIDRNYRIVAANKAYVDAYDAGGISVVGHACHEVSHHSPRPCHESGENCPLQHVLSTGESCEVIHVHFDCHNRADRVRLTGYPIRGRDGSLYLGERIFRLDKRAPSEAATPMVGSSAVFLASLGQLSAAARTQAPILLRGESGVGKELAAKFIHGQSARHDKPFFAIDCATFSQSLFESELFGHERGAFTDCVGSKKGLYELAHGGTLFLDEVGDIPFPLQAKLLRVLESGEFRRVGGNDVLKADVRLITASNRNLNSMIGVGQFRPDLYYRISGIEVALPALRQRSGDIPALAQAMLARVAALGPKHPGLTKAALAKLGSYHYPGNIRELRNIVQKAACLCGDKPIDVQHIVFSDHAATASCAGAANAGAPCRCAGIVPAGRREAPHGAEQIRELLSAHNGHRGTVANLLGISERTLYRKLKLLGNGG